MLYIPYFRIILHYFTEIFILKIKIKIKIKI